MSLGEQKFTLDSRNIDNEYHDLLSIFKKSDESAVVEDVVIDGKATTNMVNSGAVIGGRPPGFSSANVEEVRKTNSDEKLNTLQDIYSELKSSK